MCKIYVATKLTHAAKFRAIRNTWGQELWIISRWLDMSHVEHDDPSSMTDDDYKVCWIVDQHDVASCDVLLVYAEEGDELRGALVEAGMAIALNKMVIVVGNSPCYGTWQNHPNVIYAKDLDHAKRLIENYYMEPRR